MGALHDALRAKGEMRFHFSEAAEAQVHFLVDFNKVCKSPEREREQKDEKKCFQRYRCR